MIMLSEAKPWRAHDKLNRSIDRSRLSSLVFSFVCLICLFIFIATILAVVFSSSAWWLHHPRSNDHELRVLFIATTTTTDPSIDYIIVSNL